MIHKLQGFLVSTLVLSSVIFCCFIGSEVFIRYVIDDGMEYNLEMWKYARKLKRVSEDPSQGHKHIPSRSAHLMGVDVVINSHGHRNKETPINKPPGITRVVMLGDSLTLGWGVPSKNTVSERLEVLLNENGGEKRFEVINAGVGNTNTEMQVARFLADEVKFSPDIVVLNYFINDAEPIPRPTKNILMKYSAAYVFFSLRMASIGRIFFGGKQWHQYYLDLYKEKSEGWQRAQAFFKKLSKYCRSKDIRLVLVSYPELHQFRPYSFAAVTQKLKNMADRLEVPFFNLFPTLQGQKEENLWVSRQDQHPNSLACSLIARAIEDALGQHFSTNKPTLAETSGK